MMLVVLKVVKDLTRVDLMDELKAVLSVAKKVYLALMRAAV